VKPRRDYAPEAETLFREIVATTGLTVDTQPNEFPELIWHAPAQSGLSVEMVFGLQNYDELNLGIGPFWSCMFPFEKVQHDFKRLALGFIAGTCRVAEWRRGSLLYKRTLEEPSGSRWRTAYTEIILPFPLVFGRRHASFITNLNARV